MFDLISDMTREESHKSGRITEFLSVWQALASLVQSSAGGSLQNGDGTSCNALQTLRTFYGMNQVNILEMLVAQKQCEVVKTVPG